MHTVVHWTCEDTVTSVIHIFKHDKNVHPFTWPRNVLTLQIISAELTETLKSNVASQSLEQICQLNLKWFVVMKCVKRSLFSAITRKLLPKWLLLFLTHINWWRRRHTMDETQSSVKHLTRPELMDIYWFIYWQGKVSRLLLSLRWGSCSWRGSLSEAQHGRPPKDGVRGERRHSFL